MHNFLWNCECRPGEFLLDSGLQSSVALRSLAGGHGLPLLPLASLVMVVLTEKRSTLVNNAFTRKFGARTCQSEASFPFARSTSMTCACWW